jgi:hypothetical protein
VPACPAARAADPENPFKTAKVGDWASHKMVLKIQGNELEMTSKLTVTAKDDKEATVKFEGSFAGQEIPARTQKIDLTKPYNPLQNLGMDLLKNAEVKSEKLEDGKETLTVGDKKYECMWTKTKLKTKIRGNEHEIMVKAWMCKDVPAGGLVKMETKSDLGESTVTLTDHGKGK